jgi:hypothetical protein
MLFARRVIERNANVGPVRQERMPDLETVCRLIGV